MISARPTFNFMTNDKAVMTGKIIKLSPDGWGFISTKDKPFTRIFFHWTGLNSDTLNFIKLRKGMIVNFECIRYQDKGYRAIRIDVIDNEGYLVEDEDNAKTQTPKG
jgi:cold shock CspA family protein